MEQLSWHGYQSFSILFQSMDEIPRSAPSMYGKHVYLDSGLEVFYIFGLKENHFTGIFEVCWNSMDILCVPSAASKYNLLTLSGTWSDITLDAYVIFLFYWRMRGWMVVIGYQLP
ncbi:hypothetical protein OCU04_003533 [Sclerotinia nivalis]|uniref:Uncharacterized protein n=1 Tax=Sclerotinia nivalis TaxID=352851 RepID=A0A9X0DLF4_9HELO|nr:hypothetical protein OCU04_003533 [Sclerotinia nivalis]